MVNALDLAALMYNTNTVVFIELNVIPACSTNVCVERKAGVHIP